MWSFGPLALADVGCASEEPPLQARVNKEIWVAMGAEAWWMHERCMAPEEVAEHAELVKSSAQLRAMLLHSTGPHWRAAICNPSMGIYTNVHIYIYTFTYIYARTYVHV